jgi:hypothetical protein
MTSYRIRPRFQHLVSQSPAEVQEKIKQKLDDPDSRCVGRIVHGFIVLRIPHKDQHYWSPQLSLSLEEEDSGTLIRGLYGPKPTIWAMFTFGYASLGLIGLFTGIIGLSRWSLDMSAPILWVVPVTIVLAAALYVIAQTGQKVGVEQTFTLHHFYEDAVGERVHVQ